MGSHSNPVANNVCVSCVSVLLRSEITGWLAFFRTSIPGSLTPIPSPCRRFSICWGLSAHRRRQGVMTRTRKLRHGASVSPTSLPQFPELSGLPFVCRNWRLRCARHLARFSFYLYELEATARPNLIYLTIRTPYPRGSDLSSVAYFINACFLREGYLVSYFVL